ncbi:hypothetical protein NX80_014030 [Xanthomonas vasicola pv. arecae]|uniref:hypothetical protein n=1 Tax=Xanthomonas vasicola TaxID=56459 RepID=UPI000F859054|nr:hypothetical protein [Xanthomonas vasicola]AZR27398.1 hypothetical protein NX80_014030 [Xanthomonas vasicola pv. arecae]
MTSFLLRTLALSLWRAMALSRNLLQSNWSAMLRLTQGSQKEVTVEPLFLMGPLFLNRYSPAHSCGRTENAISTTAIT